MNEQNPHRKDKYRRYRERKKAMGLRELRMWVPDLRNPAVQARLRREAQAIRSSRSEKEALAFIEAMVAEDPELYR
ncbi:MAG TPA: antitoxin MazE-like protein [Allosphingosinicella sp.]|nr:antitoxin MazE-like protein [Allosphingosinicella sp.]